MNAGAEAVSVSHEPTGRSLIASASWMTGSHLLAQAFAYGSLIFLARELPPSGFGTVAVGTAVVYIATLLVDHGTYGAIMVHPRLTRTFLVRAFWRCFLVGVALGVVMAASAGPLVTTFADGGDAPAVALLALCLPLHAISLIPTALLHKSMQFRRLAGATATGNVVSAVVAVVAVLAGAGIWSLVARQVVLFGMLAVLTTVLCLPVLRRRREFPAAPAARARERTGDRWFFLFGVTLMLTANIDYLVVGLSSDASLVGLYALAFTIAMAPSTQFSEQVGKVLFAAAASHPETSGQRTVQSVRLMSALLLPLLPVGILLAPVLLPAVLGPEWTGMVAAFQVLWLAGIGYAIDNCIGEALSGTGHIAFRAKVMAVRCVATAAALWVLVSVDGIRGAALAHLAVFLPYAAVYATAGARLAGTSGRELRRALRPVAVAVAWQLVVTAVLLLSLRAAGVPDGVAVCVASAAGLAVSGFLLYRRLGGRRSP
ncbi:oligosaccharide flippase family protein [Streptomyces roseicoloratus]|uniref:oligosaccharide flippase family protein n=1 Tax=Streptomyces roseicoloratus TaxID=2508722 RepID=UPI0013E96A55|nr:oligosaccharide flippase family protein [Streptomyces roseicoloratus]